MQDASLNHQNLPWRVKLFSHFWLFVIPWTVNYQAPPSMQFLRQDHWSGLPFPSPGDLADPGIEPRSPTLQADIFPLSHQGSPGEGKKLPTPEIWPWELVHGVAKCQTGLSDFDFHLAVLWASLIPHLNNKQNKNRNQIISRQDYHFTQPYPSEGKQTNKNSAHTHSIGSLHKPLDETWGRNQKKERIQPWSLGIGDHKQNKLKKNNEKAGKYYTNKGIN